MEHAIGPRPLRRRGSLSSERLHWGTRAAPSQEPADSPQPCSVHVYRDGPGLTVQVAGELDVTSAVTLRRALRALDRASRPIGVDLSAVCFADSYGLEPLAESAVHRSRVGQPPLHVLALSPSAERIVSLLGLDWSETVCGDEWVNGNRPDE